VNASPWLVLRGARVSLKFDRRVPTIAVVLLALTIGLMIWNIGSGEYPIPAIDVLRTLLGLPTGSEKDFGFVVNTLRAPRALVGWTVGVMLALAGSVMQTLTRNALASPDITGVTAGAGLGAVILIVVLGGAAPVTLPVAALGGGLLVAVLIYVLAWRGGDSPLRLVLVGVGLASVLGAAQTLLLLRAPPEIAQRALLWLTGSIYARSWEHLFALLPWCAALVPLVLFSSARLNAIGLGDEIARGLGVRMGLQRAALLLAAVGLTDRAARRAAVGRPGARGQSVCQRVDRRVDRIGERLYRPAGVCADRGASRDHHRAGRRAVFHVLAVAGALENVEHTVTDIGLRWRADRRCDGPDDTSRQDHRAGRPEWLRQEHAVTRPGAAARAARGRGLARWPRDPHAADQGVGARTRHPAARPGRAGRADGARAGRAGPLPASELVSAVV
jgi:iron complex transport system permease protein